MARYDLVTPEGTRDLLPEDCALRRRAERLLHDIFIRCGYGEVITPGLEFYDVFQLSGRHFLQESLYKLIDRRGRLLVVRPDSTIPIARVAATRLREAALPLRLYYNQSVYSVSRSLAGRSDEVVQTGIELIGSPSRRADLEVLSMAAQVLAACDQTGFSLEIGDIGFFKELVTRLRVDEDTQERIRCLIEAKNYPALNTLLDSIGDGEAVAALKLLPRLFGGEDVFERAAEIFQGDGIAGILANLKTIFSALGKLGLRGNIKVDLGLVNRLDYYTGVVMKGYLPGCGEAVLSGGRYDRLIADFGYDVPATGFAVNVDAVVSVLAQKRGEVSVPAPQALVFGEEGFEVQALLLARSLGESGKIVEYAVFDTLLQAQRYAAQKGIAELIVVNQSNRGIQNGE